MRYKRKDHFYKKAKQEKYTSRAAYKLQEIQKKYSILKPGFKVLDLGASPGSWIQFTCSCISPKGSVVGIDKLPIDLPPPKNVTLLQMDVFEINENHFSKDSFDCILSDMAPNTSGVAFADQCASADLCIQALNISKLFLRKGGHLVCKIFQGSEFNNVREEFSHCFKNVRVFKPDSSRSRSKEIYLIGLSFTFSNTT